MDLPARFTELDTSGLYLNVPVPSNIDTSTTSYIGEFSLVPLAFFAHDPCITAGWGNDGGPVGLHSTVVHTTSNQGWATIEIVLIRLDTSFTPSGHFPVYLNRSQPGGHTRVGHDTAVCVQLYEPWIVEAYNTSTRSPSVLRILGKGDTSTSLSPSGNLQGDPMPDTGHLNTTGKEDVFRLAHDDGFFRMWELKFSENENWEHYVPPPIVGSVIPSRTTFLLTSAYSIGHLFHRRCWTPRIYRALPRPVRNYPCTGQRC